MKLVFRGGTLPEILAQMEQALASVQPAGEAQTAPATVEAAAPKPKKQSRAEAAKAKDLAEKAEAAAGAGQPAPPAPVGPSGANGTPAEPDGRMQRPMCAKHAETVDKKKFNVLEVDSSKCIQCLTEKTAAPTPPAAPTPEAVKAALQAVMTKFPAVSETEDPGADLVDKILKQYDAETVTADGYKKLDPAHYNAVIAAANALVNPPAPARPKL